MEFIPKYIKRTEEKRASEVITNDDWNTLFNLIINQGDWNTKALVDLCEELKLYSNTAEIIAMINEKVSEINSADMTQQDYDTNSDGIVNKADGVVDGGIHTNSIQDGAVTEIKLEDVLKSRINYCYSKVGLLLVLVSAQNEITGSDNLNLFGLDGTLETGYNIETENTDILLNTEGYITGSFSIKHYTQNATSLLQTNKKYTLTNNLDLNIIKLTEIIDANFVDKVEASKILTIPSYTGTSNNNTRECVDQGYIVHMKGNFYYAIIVSTYERDKTDTLHECIHVFPITYDGASITVGSRVDISYCDFQDIMVLGDYMFVISDDNLQDIGESQIDIFNIAGEHKTLSYINDADERNAGFVFSSNGNIYWSSYWRDDRETSLYKYTFTTGRQDELIRMEDVTTTSAVSINHISGHWGTVRTKDWDGVYAYYTLNLHSGALTKIEQGSDIYNNVYLSNNCVRDTDGEHFYDNGVKYRIDASGTVKVAVETITYGNLIDSLNYNWGFVHNNIFILNSKVYSIINKTCILIYDAKYVSHSLSNQSACMGIKSINEGLVYETISDDKNSFKLLPYNFTEGSITLETALEKDILGELYIKRQYKCAVSPEQTKQIYLKPTVTNTFNALNLIVYLNRELKSDDTLIVNVNGSNLTAIEASTSTTKYYELSLETATDDFEIIITAKAGATGPLQLTQILGGVDNAV